VIRVDVGKARHPCGKSSVTSASAAPGALCDTVTFRTRARRSPSPPSVAAVFLGTTSAVGTIAMSGVIRTVSAGTTSRSMRFSPLKILPS
jgi:hypothetical protein